MKKSGRKQYGEYPDERSVIVIIMIKRRKRKGRGGETPYSVIARELNDEGYRTQTGKPWYPQIVSLIINRPEINPPKKRPVKTTLGSRDYLSQQQIKICRAACSERDLIIFDFLLNTGVRAAEFCALEMKDIGVLQGKSRIDIRHGKGDVSRSVEISVGFASQLRGYIRRNRPAAGRCEPVFLNIHGDRLSYHALIERIKSIARKSGVDWLRPHKLRHTAAVLLYNYDSDILAVKKFLGHKSVKTTEIYADTLKSKEKGQAEGLFKAINENIKQGDVRE